MNEVALSQQIIFIFVFFISTLALQIHFHLLSLNGREPELERFNKTKIVGHSYICTWLTFSEQLLDSNTKILVMR